MNEQLSICALRSSSKGNSSVVFGENTKILTDCGVSGKTVESCLGELGILPSEIDAMVITHEHTDHIKGAGIFSRKYNIPVYANAATWRAMSKQIGNICDENVKIFETGKEFYVKDLKVKPFLISHDAAEPVGFVFGEHNSKIAVATDMGEIWDSVISEICGCRTALIEANYDKNMLEVGKYPYNLKLRIKSNRGHLCNDDTGLLACRLAESGTREIILGHLSGENNYPELAYQTVKNALEERKFTVGEKVMLHIIKRECMGDVCRGGKIAL